MNYGVAARGVFAIGIDGATSKDWTAGKFYSTDIGVGLLSGSVFWSPDLKWVGIAYGLGWGTGGGSYDEVEYQLKP